MGRWMNAGLQKPELETCQFEYDLDKNCHRLSFMKTYLDKQIIWNQTMILMDTGELMFENHIQYDESLPSLARVGLKFSLVPGFEDLRWFGRGPHENYQDRKAGAAVGLYNSTVDDQYVPYILPQAHGNHCDVRWFSLSDGERDIEFKSQADFEFSVSHFRQEDLFAAYHTNELKKVKRAETWIQIDHLQRGLGTGSCGPQTRADYCIEPGGYHFSYVMKIL